MDTQSSNRSASFCPFLRNVSASTDFNLWGSSQREEADSSRRGPMFSDSLNFELAFRIFHGDHGVVPLARASEDVATQKNGLSSVSHEAYSVPAKSRVPPACPFSHVARKDDDMTSDAPYSAVQGFHASLAAAPMASIGISAFGPGGPFGFDAFREAMEWKNRNERREADENKRKEETGAKDAAGEKAENGAGSHEAGDEWLATGKCPIARSYRAFNRFIPAVAAALKPPPGVRYVCPPAIVAMRAAVAKHPFMKTLRPQALPIRVLAIGTMGLFLNIPLGAWREHLVKFSPQWILVVHASVPFVAILRKAALMPKYAMAFTVAASILGQTIGSKLEKRRLSAVGDQKLEPGIRQGLQEKSVGTPALPGSVPGVKVERRRRVLGENLRGLGFSRTDGMVAYDCQLEGMHGVAASEHAPASYQGPLLPSSHTTALECGTQHTPGVVPVLA